jgi:aminodeoxyfutalosine deaminase
MPNDFQSFFRSLPKAELHLHLEGTVTPETLVELSARRHSGDGAALTREAAEALYHYSDFSGFLLAFKAITEQLQTAEDYELVTLRMLERLHRQGVVHAEVYVSVGVVYYWRRTEFEPLFAGMERARIEAEARWGISCFWIFDAVRHFGPEAAAQVFHKAAEMRAAGHASIVGIGIGGDERRTGAEPFRDLYAEAREAGLRLTAHAGETVGPGGIWAAINIGTERIGHGLSAIDDPELMAVLAERQIPIEICVTSNLRTASCPSLAEHPVRSYFDAGLMITVNSDDPTLFGSDLEGEYRLLAREFEFTREQLRELAANSLEASFLAPERKVELLRALEAVA